MDISEVRVTSFLADFAQAAEGKINVLGAGWNITGPQPVPFAIVMIFEVPWDQANRRHEFRWELIDCDGEAVVVPQPDGHLAPFVIDGGFEVGRPPGVKPGTSFNVPLPLQLGPQPIPAGGRYEWRLTVNGVARDEWRLAFSTRAASAQAEAA